VAEISLATAHTRPFPVAPSAATAKSRWRISKILERPAPECCSVAVIQRGERHLPALAETPAGEGIICRSSLHQQQCGDPDRQPGSQRDLAGVAPGRRPRELTFTKSSSPRMAAKSQGV